MNLVMIFGYYWYNSTLNKIQLSKELKKCKIIYPLYKQQSFKLLDLDSLRMYHFTKNLGIVSF